jgi:hypothetical protein
VRAPWDDDGDDEVHLPPRAVSCVGARAAVHYHQERIAREEQQERYIAADHAEALLMEERISRKRAELRAFERELLDQMRRTR